MIHQISHSSEENETMFTIRSQIGNRASDSRNKYVSIACTQWNNPKRKSTCYLLGL